MSPGIRSILFFRKTTGTFALPVRRHIRIAGARTRITYTGRKKHIMKIQTIIFDWDGTLHNTEKLYGAALRKTLRWLQGCGYAVPGHPSEPPNQPNQSNLPDPSSLRSLLYSTNQIDQLQPLNPSKTPIQQGQNDPPGQVDSADWSDARFRRYLGVNARDMWNDFMPDLPDAVKEECSRRTGTHMIECIESGMAALYPCAPEILRSLRDQGYHLVVLSNCKVPYMAAQRAHFGLDEYFDAYYCSGAYDFAPKESIFPDIAAAFPGEYLMIGDRASDRRVAEVHGIHFLGCAYGFGEPAEIRGGDGILTALADLPDKLRELQHSL